MITRKPTTNNIAIFDKLKKIINSTCAQFTDKRTGKNKQYTMQDIGMGAFSIFFTQSPSFLAHQIGFKSRIGISNAETIFNMTEIPTDNHIRNILDDVNPDQLHEVYDKTNHIFNDTPQSELYEGINGTRLLALDATWHHDSSKISCPNCSSMKQKDGTMLYYHSAITPVFVAIGQNKVIPQCPEFITPQDGSEKQDCEINGSKRWIEKHTHKYKPEKITILGDDLYSKTPLCKLLQEKGFHFILVCKPASHKTLADWIGTSRKYGDLCTYQIKRREKNKNRSYTYSYANNVPLCADEDSIKANWCELIITDDTGKKVSTSSFISDHKITEQNVELIVASGKCRWKIENENNNTLKTKGYHLEHNFGHGKKHLASLLASMNILAFLFHTILDFIDEKYKRVRDSLPTRKNFFEMLRNFTQILVFRSWDSFLEFIYDGLKERHDPSNISKYCIQNTG